MKKINILIFILFVVVAGLALSIYFQNNSAPPPLKQVTKTPPPQPVKQPIVHYPVPEKIPAQTEEQNLEKTAVKPQPEPELPEVLPPVEQSDESIQDALHRLAIKDSYLKLILLENFIQRLVTSIDNLPEKRLPRAHLPIVPLKSKFITSGTTESPQTSRRNQARYNNYVQLLESLDSDLVVKTYVHFYPLFQEAYEQLGYRNAYFNDRLVNVIDHLLETPNPPEPILLTQPSVLYVYADPLLEKLSSGQKILLRVGPNHRQQIKKILKSYREQLVNLNP